MSTALEIAGMLGIAAGVFLLSIPAGLVVAGFLLIMGGASL